MPIDLDHNATSPLDPEIFEAMRPHWFAGANAESRHSSGRAARRAVISAIETVAKVLNAHPDEVVFTSGGTEANNLAIFGLAEPARCRSGRGGHVIASPIEHPAVSAPVEKLKDLGYSITVADVSSEGRVDPEAMAAGVTADTFFLTLILAQNETGAIQPVKRLAELARAKYPAEIHTDASQAVGRIPVDFRDLGVSTLAASAHKFGGPPGVGLLLVRKGTHLEPWIFGGGQQGGKRPGTQPIPLIFGLAAALEKSHRRMAERTERWTRLRDRLERSIIDALGPDRAIRNGPIRDADRLPQTLNLGFPGIDGDLLLMRLDQNGIRASLGSACASGTTEPSPTLVAMGVPKDRLRSSVRFSLGPEITEAEIDEAARIVARCVSA